MTLVSTWRGRIVLVIVGIALLAVVGDAVKDCVPEPRGVSQSVTR